MEFSWLHSVCQCTLSLSVIVASVRLCIAVSSSRSASEVQARGPAARIQPGSVSSCLCLCLGCVGAVGGAVGIPVTLLLNLRSAQCLYTCITLVCCPLLVRQFTMFLLMLLTLDAHLQHHLADRYASVVTHRRAFCVVLLCWVGSVLSSFAQFIGSDVLSAWKLGLNNPGTDGHGLGGNWTTSAPQMTPTSPPNYPQNPKIIGSFLPYGGFLSKFYVEDMQNLTYAEIHSRHWGVCTPNTVLSPQFLVYVQGMTVFVLPLLFLLAIYFDLICVKPKSSPFHPTYPNKTSNQARSLSLSIALLVLLCLPLYVVEALLLFNPRICQTPWIQDVALFLFQLYSLVPQILFTPSRKQRKEQPSIFPPGVPTQQPALNHSGRKSLCKLLLEAMQSTPWSSAKHSLKAKVCPEV